MVKKKAVLQTINKVDRMYVTYIRNLNAEGDTFFPRWNEHRFKAIYSEKLEENGPTEFEILQRTNKGATSQTEEDIEYSINPEALAYYYGGLMF